MEKLVLSFAVTREQPVFCILMLSFLAFVSLDLGGKITPRAEARQLSEGSS